MKKIVSLCALLWLLAAKAEVVLPTAKGDLKLKAVPERIAVYDIGVLNTLIALGLEDKIVGIPQKSKREANLKLPNAKEIGTLFEPDIEALNALSPDLIIVASRSADRLQDVAKIAPAADLSLTSAQFYSNAIERLNHLGALFGKEAQAKALTDELNTLRDEVKTLGAQQGQMMVLLVNGSKIALYGPDSRVGWLKHELGLNLVHDASKEGPHGESVSFEYVGKVNPDWIYALDRLAAIGRDGESAQQVLSNPLVEKTQAFQKGHILYPDTYYLYVDLGSPLALKTTMQALKEAFSK